ncbi:DMT family transporter [Spongiibacter sp. KMU-158]|uniref:DMT family transporter n=1 Tax=Spongiibacter pelagi TaxID=2760804 RepID=A0A927GV55_9GAMM|nr:DMT family transporter [Spongiibacter pelagi]MBD2858035.1 DMT family transporter [Spongiibacter pelagi]
MVDQVGRRNLGIGIGLSILTVFLSATVAAVGKHVGQQVHISAIVMAQYSISLLFALPPIARGGLNSLKTPRPLLHLIRGVSGVACFYCYYLALQETTLVEASLLRNTAPLMVPLVIMLLLGERLSPSIWPPLLVGFIGILLVLRPGFQTLSMWHVFGVLSGLGLAISMVTTRLLVLEEPQSRILFYYFLIAVMATLPFFIFSGHKVPDTSWLWLLYMGVVMYLTFILYTQAYRYVPAATLAPINYFGVVFGGVLDWLIWGVTPTGLTLLGVALVMCGGVLVLRNQ